MTSSRANDYLYSKYQNVIGDDVIGTLELNYMSFTPIYDAAGKIKATRATNLVCQKPNGNIPNFLVKQMPKKQEKVLLAIARYIYGKKGMKYP